MGFGRDPIDFVPLPNGLRVQVLGSMSELPQGKRHHFCAFIQDVQTLVVWDDTPEKALDRASRLEASLIEMIWRDGDDSEECTEAAQADEKEAPGTPEEGFGQEKRPIRLGSSVVVACSMALCISCLGLGWRNLAVEILVDNSYLRLALLAASPVQIFVSLVCFVSPFLSLSSRSADVRLC